MAEIRRVTDPADALAAARLFDGNPTVELAAAFLAGPGNHLLVAYEDDVPTGFVSGIEVRHPDKPVEMMMFELAVAESHRRRGIGGQLVRALSSVASNVGCAVMWAPTEPDNAAALATYIGTGASVEKAAIATWNLS